ncbi:hypothetical protein KM043_006760 [Ampulex compressa]|nr:hypothetical protein KM043_006760 [Ampulex compressa]
MCNNAQAHGNCFLTVPGGVFSCCTSSDREHGRAGQRTLVRHVREKRGQKGRKIEGRGRETGEERGFAPEGAILGLEAARDAQTVAQLTTDRGVPLWGLARFQYSGTRTAMIEAERSFLEYTQGTSTSAPLSKALRTRGPTSASLNFDVPRARGGPVGASDYGQLSTITARAMSKSKEEATAAMKDAGVIGCFV